MAADPGKTHRRRVKREPGIDRGPAPAVVNSKNLRPSPTAHYEAGLKSGTFRVQRCNGCSKPIFYPRVACPHCASMDLAWLEPSGLGTVYSTTTVNRSSDKGGPYNVALIELAEGVRLMSRVDGVPPDEVRIGMVVRVDVELMNGTHAPVFHPVEDRGRS